MARVDWIPRTFLHQIRKFSYDGGRTGVTGLSGGLAGATIVLVLVVVVVVGDVSVAALIAMEDGGRTTGA